MLKDIVRCSCYARCLDVVARVDGETDGHPCIQSEEDEDDPGLHGPWFLNRRRGESKATAMKTVKKKKEKKEKAPSARYPWMIYV